MFSFVRGKYVVFDVEWEEDGLKHQSPLPLISPAVAFNAPTLQALGQSSAKARREAVYVCDAWAVSK